MTSVAFTVDIDWACEPAIEETLDFFRDLHIPVTVFTTHRSRCVEAALPELEVGIHPFFSPESSHGSTVGEVVRQVLDLPHNFAGFRAHRFAIPDGARRALLEAGISVSSNVCGDLVSVPPFPDRFGMVEVPIFMEDGGYLARDHPLDSDWLHRQLDDLGPKVLVVHPMHFAVNSPHIDYMVEIKRSHSRAEWTSMTGRALDKLRWRGRGIRDLIADVAERGLPATTVGALAQQRVRRA